jgi:hypothetical protein
MKPVTDRGNSRVYLFIQSFILPIFLSIIVSAFIIVTALRRSLDIGRLSIPPVYDDVVYLYFSQSILHAASHQSLAATVWQIIDQHSPLTILFGVIGYSVVNAGDVGPYIARLFNALY